MKKIVSSLLITVGSLGILAGIAGAVYALSRNGSKIKDWITGDSSSQKTSKDSSSSEESEEPSQSSSSHSSSHPQTIPFDDPSKPLGVTVTLEQFEYFQESSLDSIHVPLSIYTTGWSPNSELTLTYEVVGYLGQAVSNVSLKKVGSSTSTEGATGDLSGGGNYVLTIDEAGYDRFYVYQFNAIVSDGSTTHIGQAKFVTNGAGSVTPYEGSDVASGISLKSLDGTGELKSIQTLTNVANSASYYVVSSYADSTKMVQIEVTPYEEGDSLMMSTDDYGSSATSLTVPVGTRIDFAFPEKADGECDRYNVQMSFVETGATVYNLQLRNYGVGLDNPVFIHPEETTYVYDPETEWTKIDMKALLKVKDDVESALQFVKVEFADSIKNTISAKVTQRSRSENIGSYSYNKYIQFDKLMSDQTFTLWLGPLSSGESGTVTVKSPGGNWAFTYSGPAASVE